MRKSLTEEHVAGARHRVRTTRPGRSRGLPYARRQRIRMAHHSFKEKAREAARTYAVLNNIYCVYQTEHSTSLVHTHNGLSYLIMNQLSGRPRAAHEHLENPPVCEGKIVMRSRFLPEALWRCEFVRPAPLRAV